MSDQFNPHLPKNQYTQVDPEELSIDEMRQIIKTIAAYNHEKPLEFSKAFLQYADSIQIKIERPTPDTIRIHYVTIK